jgi:hypothetical protein
MQFIRDITDSIGIQASHFDYLITAVIVAGGIWAVVRLYQDFTRPLDDENNGAE